MTTFDDCDLSVEKHSMEWTPSGLGSLISATRLHDDVLLSDKLAILMLLNQNAAIPLHVTTKRLHVFNRFS